MFSEYPYIQTIFGYDHGISAYAIQPVGDADSLSPAEENPIISFGPLERINIFVGATNAGKSRFLRMLAKAPQHRFFEKEIERNLKVLLEAALWLSSSQGRLTLEIRQDPNHSPSAVFAAMHSWVKDALPGIRPGVSYNKTFDAQFFAPIAHEIKVFFTKHILQANTSDKMEYLTGENAQIGIWMKNILEKENEFIPIDEEKEKSGSYFYENFKSITYRRKYVSYNAMDWSKENVAAEWEYKFISFWNALSFLQDRKALPTSQPADRVYVPTLRSAVSLRDNNGNRLALDYDLFEQTVRKNYGIDDPSLKVFTGNSLYDILHHDNRNWESRDRLKQFRQFLGEAFFDGREVEMVALSERSSAGQHISVRVPPDAPRELHDLGDGINTLIILLYQVFMAKPGSWIFIEEPELNLHPGLQRVFLQTLLENEAIKARNLRVFFTTHSNHLLRMTLRDGTIASNDISIFSFQQRETNKNHFLIRPLVSEHHAALALLGVQNASVLLAQCGVWVEGPTDRQYLRAYLDAFQRSDEFKKRKKTIVMREDAHFAFWEYAGSNLSHYMMSPIPQKGTAEFDEYNRGRKEVLAKIQSSALCNRIFLLADRDETKQKKHDDLTQLAATSGNLIYHVPKCIEIENLLSPANLKAILPKFLKGTVTTTPEIRQADYKELRMGSYLKNLFPAANFPSYWAVDKRTSVQSKKAENFTLETTRKTRLCELAVEVITWETMSKEAQDLALALYDFLETHNSI